MAEVGNMAQVEEKPKKSKKATKAKAAKSEVEAAPETAPEATNGAKKIDEVETVTEAVGSTTEATLPIEESEAEPTGMQKIYKDREDLTEKMMSGKAEEATLAGTARYIDAPIFPDAYCPLCGQKLSGNSKTGFKQSLYTHPFTPSIALGKPCELKGKRLRAPVARMEIID
jgi:DNA repair exonuclease SbcCD ATPase subunit